MRTYVVFFVLFSICVHAQDRTYTQMYYLDFHQENDSLFNWYVSRDKTQGVVIHDTTVMKNNKHPLGIFQRRLWNVHFPININICQNVLLPRTHSASYAKLTLHCKGQNLRQAYMIGTSLDYKGHVMAADTVFLIENNDWQAYSCVIPLKGSAMLNIQIEVKGNYDKIPQKLLLDYVDIQLDNCSLDRFAVQDSYGERDSLIENPLPLSFDTEKGYSQINFLDKSKVLALGETLHGSASMTKVATDIMKYQVQHNHCKLILLERPVTQWLTLNRYVQGDDSVCPDSLLFADKFPLGKELQEFMLWLRSYNKTAEKKVGLYGIDIDVIDKDEVYWLCEYLRTLKGKKDISKIDSLCWQLVEGKNIDNIVDKAQSIPELKEILNEKEYNVFLHTLKHIKDRLGKRRASSSDVLLLRDSLMNSCADYLIDELVDLSEEKVVMYTHLRHSAFLRDPIYRNKMLGTYMREKYRKDYTCIGLTVGKGSFLTIDSDQFVIKKLNPPVYNSLESVMEELGLDYCYASVRHDSYSACMIRGFGSVVKDNQYINLSSLSYYMDGVIYVRESKPTFYPKELLNKRIEKGYIQRVWKNYGKIKKYRL